MVIRTDEMVRVISTLSDESGLKVTLNESVKGGLLTGIACTIGGLVLGPAGLAIGGTLGGIVAYLKTDGKFKPVSQVILYEMDEIQRQQLVGSVQTILNDLDAADTMQLLVLLNGNAALKARVLTEVTSFIQNQLHMAVL